MKKPKTVDDWELYSGKDSEEAARELTLALDKAEAELRKGLTGKASVVLGKLMDKHLDPVMQMWQRCGTWDSEPRWVAKGYLRTLCQELYGTGGDADF